MFISLLFFGLLATPFIFIPGLDIRDIKMVTAFSFAIVLGMAEIKRHGLWAFQNKWLIALLIYVPFSILFAPSPSIKLIGIDVSNFWSWQPLCHIITFSLMAMAVASHEFINEDIELLLKTMMWAGFITALYMVLQFFFVDQFFMPLDSFIP